MRVALFVPCYVDQLRPEVGLATLALLRNVGIEPEYPADQTCCGQPFLTAGRSDRAIALGRRCLDVFAGFDRIVTPSGSCAATLRKSLQAAVEDPRLETLAARTRELCEFLVEEQRWPTTGKPLDARVGLHASCHALRELALGTPSETRDPPRIDPARSLLERLPGLQLVDLARRDECCGFGGLFSVVEEAVSTRMGLDRLEDHRRGRAEIVTSTDVSCLMHLEGLARRRGRPLRFAHVAELLAESLVDPADGAHPNVASTLPAAGSADGTR